MQKLTFAVPSLFFSWVVLAILIYLQCDGHIEPFKTESVGFSFSFYRDYENIEKPGFLIFGFIWLCSTLYVAKHVFYEPKLSALKLSQVFLTTNISSFAPVCHILYSRKNKKDDKDQSIRYKNEQKKRSVFADDSGTEPEVIACATMWHETKTEMEKLIKSIMMLIKDNENMDPTECNYFKFSG